MHNEQRDTKKYWYVICSKALPRSPSLAINISAHIMQLDEVLRARTSTSTSGVRFDNTSRQTVNAGFKLALQDAGHHATTKERHILHARRIKTKRM